MTETTISRLRLHIAAVLMEVGFIWLKWRLPVRDFGWWLSRRPIVMVNRRVAEKKLP
jgi:hypothetical protein